MDFLQLFEGEGGEAQATTTETTAAKTEGTPSEERKTFDQLLEDADYKAEYDKRVKDAVGKRMRTANAKINQAKEAEPILQRLRERYGAESAQDILSALDKDDAWMEDKAAAAGMSKEAYAKMAAMERQLNQQQVDAEEARRQAEWQGVLQDAERVGAMYPGFDLDAEVQGDQRFMAMVHSFAQSGFGNPVQLAYEAIHRKDLAAQQVNAAVAETRVNVANAIATGSQRPVDNGAKAASSTTTIDPAKLNYKQIEDIKRRMRMGEKIAF